MGTTREVSARQPCRPAFHPACLLWLTVLHPCHRWCRPASPVDPSRWHRIIHDRLVPIRSSPAHLPPHRKPNCAYRTVLFDFHTLDELTERGTISSTVFTDDSDFLRSLGHFMMRKVAVKLSFCKFDLRL